MGWSDVVASSLVSAAPPHDPALAPENLNLRRWGNFLAAIKDFNLTPQEQNLYRHGLNNMAAGMEVRNPDGSVSTILQTNIQGPDGRSYNVPTVWDGKILPPLEGAQRAIAEQGWNYWPSYATPEEADARYMSYHSYMDRDAAPPGWDALSGDR